ncbi:hypothetical protein KKG45_08790 [bacterium]|nr:hypothetical protein [bacterium]MBU1073330.1 hypothetical protein [bacterium]MBU1675715.1 hypothetical protein [bacterium]
MHDGCGGVREDGRAMVDKLRMMGFRDMPLPVAARIECECGEAFVMSRFEDHCPHCGMVYGVTLCHAGDPSAIRPAGRDY